MDTAYTSAEIEELDLKCLGNVVSHRERLIEELRGDLEYQEAYLNAALDSMDGDGDRGDVLLAIRTVIAARNIKISELAAKVKIERQTLYRVLSQDGNPTMETLFNILLALGLKINVRLSRPTETFHAHM